MKKKSNHLGLFAKYWQPGKVKTRLATTFGNVAASQVYLEFLKYLLAKFNHISIDKTVVFSPTENRSDFLDLLQDDWSLEPQSEGDLGNRLTHYFRHSTNRFHRSIVIGSDCLTITPQLIDEAFAAIETHDMVIGPSHDGGYYLLGLSDFHPNLFKNISWSSPAVFEQTFNIAQTAGLSIQTLEPLCDIDEQDDLERFIKSLQTRTLESLDEKLLDVLMAVMNS